MARLTIEQIKAPDLSVASAATARAGETFRKGMSSASDLLSQYQSGLEAQGDAELTNLLAGAKNEDEWNSILASTDFSKMNISAGMRQNIMNRRDNILGYENQRADTRLVDANTGNVNATADRTRNQIGLDNNADARLQGNYDWEHTRRRQLGGLVGTVLESERDGRTNGYQGASGLQNENVSGLAQAPGTNLGPRADGSGINTLASRGMEGRFMNAVRQGGITNPYGLAAIAATGHHESGFSAENGNRTWSDPSETGRPGTAGGYMSWNNDRLEAMKEFTGGDTSPEAQAAYLLNEDPVLMQKLNNARSIEEAVSLMNNAWRFAGYNRSGGEAEARLNTARNMLGTYGGSSGRTQNPNQGGPARDRLYAALSQTTNLDPATALAITQGDYDFAQTGQNAIRTEEDRIANQLLDAAIVQNIDDPTVFRPGDLTENVYNTLGLTPAQRLKAIERGRSAEETAGTLYTPNVEEDPVLSARIQAQIERETRAFENSPSYKFLTDAKQYEQDPVASLQEKLNLTSDDQALPEETSNNLMRYIDDIVAQNPNVSRGEVVAAMERSFVRDPGDDANSSFWINSDVTLNTIKRRFPQERITELLGQFAGPKARNRFDRTSIDNISSRTGIQKTMDQREELLQQAQLYPEGHPERLRLVQEAQQLETMLHSGNSKTTVENKLRQYLEETPSIAERLSGLNPDSVEYDKALADVETGIQSDSSLTKTEKRLMIAALRG